MKRKFLFTAIITCVFLFVSGNMYAQASFNYYAKETLETIGASPELQKKIQELKRDYDKKIRAVRQDSNLTDEEKKITVQKYYKERTEQYFGMFTPEQQEHIKRLRKEIREKQSN